jgi:peptidoglycan/xylan/chitin deacetylase (PgdA/CDA1 family)
VRLADGGLVEVGAHSVTHPSLSKLDREAQRNEIRNSRCQLESIIGSPVTSFSYPHGRFGANSAEEVAAAGFHCACSSLVDLARPSSPLYCLPRVQARAESADEFHKRLRYWFEG